MACLETTPRSSKEAEADETPSRDANWALYSLTHYLPPHLQDKWLISLPVQERSGSRERRGEVP